MSSNHVPWIVIGVCDVACMALLFFIRVLLARENKRRDAEPPDYTFDDVYVVTIDKDGNRTEVKVPKVRISILSGKLVIFHTQLHIIPQIGVLGLDRSSKQRLQICPVIPLCRDCYARPSCMGFFLN